MENDVYDMADEERSIIGESISMYVGSPTHRLLQGTKGRFKDNSRKQSAVGASHIPEGRKESLVYVEEMLEIPPP